MDIKEPVRVLDLNELKKGDRIWSVKDGKWQILTFVDILGKQDVYNRYGIFTNTSHDGLPKFNVSRLKEERWYRYDDSDETWYYIYKELTEDLKNKIKYYEECMNSKLEDINGR